MPVKNLSIIKKILLSACVIYSFLITAVFLLGVYINSAWLPTVNMVFSLILFSLVMSCANVFLFSDRLVFPLRLLIHYAVTSVCFYIVFVFWGGYKANGGSLLTVFLVYTFAYVIFSVIIGCFRYLTADLRASSQKYTKQFEKTEEYTSQFTDKK